MELRHLRHFLAVAETLHFTRAAERLTMASSPLSRSIQQLEAELGGPLFTRGTRKVELTRLGESLIPYAEKTLGDIDTLKRAMHRRVLGHPEFYVGIRSVPRALIAEIVDDIIRVIEPQALIRLEPMDSFAQLDRVIDGRLALGLINRRAEDRRLEYLPVLLETPAIALPDRPRYAELTAVSPEDLADLQLLVQPGVEPFGPPMDRYRDAAASVRHVGSDVIGGLSAAIALSDVCCLTTLSPSAPWHQYLFGPGVVIRPLSVSAAQATTYLAWRVDRDTDDDLGAVLGAARARFDAPREF